VQSLENKLFLLLLARCVSHKFIERLAVCATEWHGQRMITLVRCLAMRRFNIYADRLPEGRRICRRSVAAGTAAGGPLFAALAWASQWLDLAEQACCLWGAVDTPVCYIFCG